MRGRRGRIRRGFGVSNRIDERKDRFTDKDLLDFLQAQTDKNTYTGKVVFRWSRRKHGWRLQETLREGAKKDVREAIADAIKTLEGNAVNERELWGE
jgi:hypothetical protein